MTAFELDRYKHFSCEIGMLKGSLVRLAGPNLALRLINLDDSAFIHGLRTNAKYNKHLSATFGTVSDQKKWIEKYKTREASGAELYYIIERIDQTRCGTVRLTNIRPSCDLTYESWILDENKPPKAALESALLALTLGFELLNCEEAHVDVRINNTKAEENYRRLGMIETHRTDDDIYFVIKKSRFEKDKIDYKSVLLAEE